jgi:hypothetical protein
VKTTNQCFTVHVGIISKELVFIVRLCGRYYADFNLMTGMKEGMLQGELVN